jgi:hypothetical protein
MSLSCRRAETGVPPTFESAKGSLTKCGSNRPVRNERETFAAREPANFPAANGAEKKFSGCRTALTTHRNCEMPSKKSFQIGTCARNDGFAPRKSHCATQQNCVRERQFSRMDDHHKFAIVPVLEQPVPDKNKEGEDAHQIFRASDHRYHGRNGSDRLGRRCVDRADGSERSGLNGTNDRTKSGRCL